MRKFLVFLGCLLIPLALAGQMRTGNISGTVVDTEGNPLPGVSLILTGGTISPIPTQSNEIGKFRFLSLFPANDYEIKATMPGFKTKIEAGIIVNVARTSDIVITMEAGAIEEEVTVIAETPIVETKKTQITHTVNSDMLQQLPSARDPWVMLQLTPSVFIDRENIGGVESGQQSSFVAKGSTTQEWTVDGMQITDRNSGGSPGYFDFDSFEEMNISVGTLDVEHRDPGIVINLVTRRGGNRTSLGGRFYYTNKKFQASISDEQLAEIGIGGYNRANDILDFGFNAGGPIIKDKVWWWFGYGNQQIKTFNLVNTADDTYLTNYTGKINLQLIPQNRMEFFFEIGKKEKFGRSSSESFPPGWNQGSKFYFGNPTYKFQDEHMFGDNLFLSVRAGKSNAGFGMWPANDMELTQPRWYDVEQGLYYNSQTWFYSDRPHPYIVLQAQYFNDNLFGTAHEVKVGFEINNNHRTYQGGYPGNFRFNTNFNSSTMDWDGDGSIDVLKDDFGIDIKRLYVSKNDLMHGDGAKRMAFYFSDTISAGRINLNVGFRFDRYLPYIDPLTTTSLFLTEGPDYFKNYDDMTAEYFTPDAAAAIKALLPDSNRDYIEPGKLWWTFSPRLGLTYDIFGDGKTIAKVAYSLYRGSGLGTSFWTPYGMYGSMNFYWYDENDDVQVSLNELYWADYSTTARTAYRVFDDLGNFVGNYEREYSLHWSGFTWGSTALNPPTAYVDIDAWSPSRTHELTVSIEREIFRDFGASISYSWKRMGNFSWSRAYYPEEYFPGLNNHIRTTDDYEIGGYVPDVLDNGTDTFDPGQAAGRPWYVLKNIPETASTAYTWYENQTDAAHDIYMGMDFVLNKRLSHKWMFNGSFTWQRERAYYGENYLDPTNQWAYEGKEYGFSMGGTSGKTSRVGFSRWMLKLMGLYQLPYDINVSATISAHEGYFYETSFGLQDRTLPNPRSYSNSMLIADRNNRPRLGDVWTINAKIEKMLRLGDRGRLYIAADVFNVLNSHLTLRKYDISYGTFRYTGGPDASEFYRWYAPATYGSGSGNINEIMNPFLVRLGIRFQI